MSTSVASVVSHFPSAENGFVTTLASTISSGATTVPLNSVAGYANGEIAVFVVDPTDASKKQTFTGVIDTAGVQVTSVVWTAGTNQTHTGGATVVDYATATHISMMTKGILVHADQDGTLKSGAVDNAAVLASDVVTTAKILNANVTAAKLATASVTPEKLLAGTGTTWPYASWTPTFTNLTVGNGTLTAKYTQIGKLVHGYWMFLIGTTSSIAAGNVSLTLPVTASSSYTAATDFIGDAIFVDTGSDQYVGWMRFESTTTMQAVVFRTDATYGKINGISNTVPHTWAIGDYIGGNFTYEAA